METEKSKEGGRELELTARSLPPSFPPSRPPSLPLAGPPAHPAFSSLAVLCRSVVCQCRRRDSNLLSEYHGRKFVLANSTCGECISNGFVGCTCSSSGGPPPRSPPHCSYYLAVLLLQKWTEFSLEAEELCFLTDISCMNPPSFLFRSRA